MSSPSGARRRTAIRCCAIHADWIGDKLDKAFAVQREKDHVGVASRVADGLRPAAGTLRDLALRARSRRFRRGSNPVSEHAV